MPWFAVGVSLIATLLSSVAYLGTPGVVWRFGFAIFLNTLVGIAITVVLILFVTIPFFVRFRFTTAYEYLEHRFSLSVRLLGATMFLLFMTIYMGVIVLLSARALAVATGLPLLLIIASVGTVATLYTMMGGIRAVIWTDVIQVALLVGGGLFAIGYVAWSTGSGPLDWIQVVNARDNESMPLASLDPTIPATVPHPHPGRRPLAPDGPYRQPDHHAALLFDGGHAGGQAKLSHQRRRRHPAGGAAHGHRRQPDLLLHGGCRNPSPGPGSGQRPGPGRHLSLLRRHSHSRRTRGRHLCRPSGGLHVHHRLGRQLLRHRGHRRLRPAAPETDEKPRGPGPFHHAGRGTGRHPCSPSFSTG